jgi:transcriptional regulator with XRE-family HTH domain
VPTKHVSILETFVFSDGRVMDNLPTRSTRAAGDDVAWFEQIEVNHIDEVKLDFAAAVDRELERCQLSRSGLARALGTSPAWVTKVLRGDANPTVETMQRVASAVGCDLFTHLAPKGVVGVWVEIQKAAADKTLTSGHYFPRLTRGDSELASFVMSPIPVMRTSSEYIPITQADD